MKNESEICFTLVLKIDKKGSMCQLLGNVDTGIIKLAVGELELIKLRLLLDLNKRLSNEEPKDNIDINKNERI